VPVSGKVESTDPSFEAAARRELAEETGLSSMGAPTSLDWSFPFAGPDGRRWRLTAYAVEVPPQWSPSISAEHDDWAWLEPEEALGRLHYEDNREALRRLIGRVSLVP
jgi:8-oxo-dGTP pyrophosphatase MutT (NUDIX family)